MASRTRVSVVAVCAGAAGVAAGEVTQINLMVRPWGSVGAWSDALTLHSSNLIDPIDVEVGAFYSRSSGYGLATVVHSIVGSPYSAALGDAATILDRSDSSMHPDGRLGNFNWEMQAQAAFTTGTSGADANRFRIGGKGNTGDVAGGGISISQNTPVSLGAAFDTSNNVYGYHFKLSLACYAGGAARTVTIDAPLDKVGDFRSYVGAATGDTTSLLGTLLPTDPATVTVSWIPAPGSLGVVGLGMATVSPRRRRRPVGGAAA